ncbi:Ig-like domain-containing protein [Vibrio sp.]|nr:Ig-like domain-containing protein [Vibrio sp.]
MLKAFFFAMFSFILHGCDSSSDVSHATNQKGSDRSVVAVSSTEKNVLSQQGGNLPEGSQLQLEAVQLVVEGKSYDVTAISQDALWRSSNENIAIVDAKGVVTAKSSGSVKITALYDKKTSFNSALINVTSATVTQFEVLPAQLSLIVGESQQLQVQTSFTDGSTQEMAASFTWTSSDPNIASVDENGKVTGLSAGEAIIYSSNTVSELGDSARVVVEEPNLLSLILTPDSMNTPVGVQQAIEVMGLFDNGEWVELTEQAIFSVSDQSVIELNQNQVKGISTGQALVTASVDDVSATSIITITAAELTSLYFEPSQHTLAVGHVVDVTLVGQYSDSTEYQLSNSVSWLGDDVSIAYVNDDHQLVGLSEGNTEINASYQGVTTAESLMVTVNSAELQSIRITPKNSLLIMDKPLQLEAIGLYSDGNEIPIETNIIWLTESDNIQVNTEGVVVGLSEGVANVSAKVDSIQAEQVANILVEDGVIDRNKPSVTVTKIEVTPESVTIEAGQSEVLRASVYLSDGRILDGTDLVSWSSSDHSAFVSAKGKVYGLSNGEANVIASLDTFYDEALVTVTPTTACPERDCIPIIDNIGNTGGDGNGNNTGNSGNTGGDGNGNNTGNSGNTGGDGNGNNTGNSGNIGGDGNGNNTGNSGNTGGDGNGNNTGNTQPETPTIAYTAIISKELRAMRPNGTKMPIDTELTLALLSLNSEREIHQESNDVTWVSSEPRVASIDERGQVRALSEGVTNITAQFEDTTSYNSIFIEVVDVELVSLTVTPPLNRLPVGEQISLNATGRFNDGTTQDLTSVVFWESQSPLIVQVSDKGEVSAISAGVGRISANYNGVKSVNQAVVDVEAAKAVSLDITPKDVEVQIGQTVQFTAVVTYDNGHTEVVTDNGIWTIKNQNFGYFEAPGLVKTTKQGSTQVSVEYGQLTSGTAKLKIKKNELESISITPNALDLALGHTATIQAIGHYSDGSEEVLTNSAHLDWQFGSPNVAFVDLQGTLRTLNVGTTSLVAKLDNVRSAPANVSVTNAVVEHIYLLPTSLTLTEGLKQQLVAIGRLSNGVEQDITHEADWLSHDTHVVLVDYLGVLFANNAGETTVSASYVQGNQVITSTVPMKVNVLESTIKPIPPVDKECPNYVEGYPYEAGDCVTNHNELYECKPWPYTPWCAGVAWAYEPGMGSAWDQAWVQK